jgi:hypothetical protein
MQIEKATALDEIVAAIRTVEGQLAALEGKNHRSPTVQMDPPNRSACVMRGRSLKQNSFR